MIKKFLTLFLVFNFFAVTANANAITSYIKKSNIESASTVGVLVVNTKNDHIVYQKNTKKLLNPASTLKLLTFGASYYVLKDNYKFKTSIYKDSNNNLYLKLAADPLFTKNDLNKLLSNAKNKINVSQINNIYIDSSIIDKTPYPQTWMQEDIWPNQRAITPYIIDNNFTEVSIIRSSLSTKVDIIQNGDYKLPIINELKLGQKQDYKISRAYGENSPIVSFKGTIKEDEIIKLPVLNPEVNFIVKLNKSLNNNKYQYLKKIQFAKTPKNAIEIASVSHTIEEVSVPILKHSDNFVSEVVSKVATAKSICFSRPATNEDMINMFNDTYKEIKTDDIKITDSSGVSRSNLVTLEFLITAFKYISSKTKITDLMITANEGTLNNRMLFLSGNLKAKTGTLSNMSSIVGNLTSKKNNSLTFGIIVQNSPKRKALLKTFEDNLITLIYRKY